MLATRFNSSLVFVAITLMETNMYLITSTRRIIVPVPPVMQILETTHTLIFRIPCSLPVEVYNITCCDHERLADDERR